MSKIGRTDASRLLSRQVSGARYFFLNLAPRRAERVGLVMGGFEHCNPDYAITRVHFPYTSIEYVVSGHGHAKVGSRRFDLGPGSIFAYGPATPHEIHTAPNDVLVKYFITLAGRGVAQRLRQCRLPPGKARQLAPGTEIAGVFEQLLREGRRAGPRRLALSAVLLDFLLLKITDAATQALHPSERAREAFLRCKAFVDAEAAQLRTLNEIARAVGAEASSVCRWFRRFQGMSPYQYLLRRRLDIAAEHLVERGGLVKEAAASLGFSDPFHFSHRFKAVHGIAPSALLRHRRRSARQ